MADVAVIIGAVGGVAATLITAVSSFMSARNTDRLKAQELSLAAMKLDQERMARDLGQRTRDLQDTLGTIDDRTGSTQRIAEGLAFAAASGNTPMAAPIRAQPPPAVAPLPPIPTGTNPGYKR